MGKKGFVLGAIGAAAAIGTAYLAIKVSKEIEDYPEEGLSYNEKAEKYFAEKWKNFKATIEEKNKQIEEISSRVKEDVIKEIDELKRKELFENAASKIDALKEEIIILTEERRQDLIKISNKVKSSNLAKNVGFIAKTACDSIKSVIDKQMRSNEVYEVEVDFDALDNLNDDTYLE